MSPGSTMPPYPWLLTDKLDVTKTGKKIRVMRSLGVPYADGYEERALDDLKTQADEIATRLAEAKLVCEWDTEIIALIAYLQRLGTDIRVGATGMQ